MLASLRAKAFLNLYRYLQYRYLSKEKYEFKQRCGAGRSRKKDQLRLRTPGPAICVVIPKSNIDFLNL